MMIISGWWWWGGGGWWWRRRWWWWLFCQMVCPRNLLAAHMRQGVEDQQVIREAPAWAKNHWRWEDHEWQGLSGQRRDRRWQISPGRHFGHHDGVDRRFKSHAAKSPGHQKVGRKRCLSLKLVFFAVGVVVCSMLVISLNFCWLRFDSIMIQWQHLALQPASVEQVCEECRWSLDEDLDSPFLFLSNCSYLMVYFSVPLLWLLRNVTLLGDLSFCSPISHVQWRSLKVHNYFTSSSTISDRLSMPRRWSARWGLVWGGMESNDSRMPTTVALLNG